MTRHTTTRPAPTGLPLRVLAGLVLAVLTFGVPAFLAYAGGWPLPSSIPTTWPAWEQLLTTPISDRAVFNLLLIAGWMIWATFAFSVIDEFRQLHRSRAVLEETDRAGRRFSPIRGLAGLLVATVAAGTVALTTNAVAASSASAAPPPIQVRTAAVVALAAQFPAEAPQATPPALPAGLGILVVNGCPHLYTVQAGDTLWHIANECLGDPNRWPEIWDLNKGQFWLEVSGYSRLTDPDLIYPRWTLTLPADATPATDTQVEPTTPSSAEPQPEPTATTVAPTPSPTTPTASPTTQQTATTEPSPTATSSTPAAAPVLTAGGTSTGIAAPSSTPAPTPSPPPTSTDTAVAGTETGIDLPGGSWLPWALVAALTAAASMVWLQRRRRYHPDIPDLPDEAMPLPEPLPALQRALRRHPTLGRVDPTVTDPTETGPHTPAVPWPTGGVGLLGDGATAAARAAIVAALASGGRHHYHQRAQVILDRPTFATLFGEHTEPEEWSRLTVGAGPGHAIATTLERILYRTRILNEYNLDDLDALRIHQPSEEALPPILHLALSPAPLVLGNAIGMNAMGANVEVTSLYIGAWPDASITIAADGTTDADDPALGRVAVLNLDDAIAALALLHEAHTGDAPDTATVPTLSEATTQEAPGAEPIQVTEPSRASSDDDMAAAPPDRAFLRTMGRPGIDTVTRGFRAKAAELAVYLACHPDGAAVRDIAEYLLPDAQLHAADQQIHTNVSNLRRILGQVGGQLLKHDGRYRLDPATITVDIWVLRANVRAATDADPDRRRQLLQEACDLCIGPLAEGQDYEWVEPHVEAVRRWATKAHLMLAGDLLHVDEPQAAATVLAQGIRLDRYNEELYRTAMRAHTILHEPQAIKALMRALTKALSDIDVEPSEETYEMVKQLLSEIAAR